MKELHQVLIGVNVSPKGGITCNLKKVFENPTQLAQMSTISYHDGKKCLE